MKKTLIILIALVLFASIYGQVTDAIYQQLIKAIEANDNRTFDKLISQIPDVNAFIEIENENNGFTLLGYACRENKISMVEKLLNRGADVEKAETDEFYEFGALFVAVRGEAVELVRLLLNKGADPNRYLNEERLSFLSIACRQSNYEIARLLIENGALVDGLGDNEWTDYAFCPLVDAVGSGSIQLVQLLLDNGANVDGASREGGTRYTPLDIAKRDDKQEMLKLLLERQNLPTTSSGEKFLEFETARLHIRIEEQKDGSYRYTSWQRDKYIQDKPILVIENGKYITADKGYYTFEYGDYSYSISAEKGKNSSYSGFLLIKKNGMEILKEQIIN